MLHIFASVAMAMLPLVSSLRLPPDSVWRQQQGLHVVDGPGALCMALSGTNANDAVGSCVSWDLHISFCVLYAVAKLVHLSLLYLDSPEKDSHELLPL